MPNEELEEKLKKFSKGLLALGKEIETKLAEKGKLEAAIRVKENQIRKLETEIFNARTKLAKLDSELMELQKRMDGEKGE